MCVLEIEGDLVFWYSVFWIVCIGEEFFGKFFMFECVVMMSVFLSDERLCMWVLIELWLRYCDWESLVKEEEWFRDGYVVMKMVSGEDFKLNVDVFL